jgi:hypothetical protein
MLANIQFTPNNLDLICSSYAGIRSRPFLFAAALAFFVVLPWLVAFVAIVLTLLGEFISRPLIAALVLGPPLMAALFALLPVSLFRNARSLRGPHNYEFTREGMRFTGPGFDNRLGWSLVTRCSQSRVGMLLMSDSLPIVFLPKRVLSPEVSDQMRALLAAANIPINSR